MRRAEYHEPEPWPRQRAEQAFVSGDAATVCDALIAVTLHDADRPWVEGWLRQFASHNDRDVRGLVAMCIGHVARIHGAVDPELAGPVLDRLEAEPELAGRVADARDDLAMFLRAG